MGSGEDDPVRLLPQLREQLEAAGRDPNGFEVTIYFCPPIAEVVERCREAGITRVLFPAPSLPGAELEPILDGYGELIA